VTNHRPIGIDLFAGVGGLSLGFEQAGFDVAAAVEIDPVHCAAHKFNFPETAIIPHSVQDISGAHIRAAAGIGSRRVDCVFGGAPCQGFSLIGHRAVDDPRNRLVKDFVRIVAELDARSFVFENVKGLTIGKHKGFLSEVVAEFEAAGYCVVTPWKVLNAAHYGTPQSRERLILIGVKKGEVLPEYPAPVTNIAGKRKTFPDLGFGPTSYDALNDLPNADELAELVSDDAVRVPMRDDPSEYAAHMRCLSNDSWRLGRRRIWDQAVMTSSARTSHTEISRRRFLETAEGTVEPISRFFKLARTGVSNTLRAGTDGARGAFTSPRPIHYEHPRCITVREMARLHGFPDWFRFNVTKWHGARQIGNAVPPPLAYAVAERVRFALGFEVQAPVDALHLGDEALLRMSISEAAAYFGVKAPSNRRTTSSGTKKRKQVDIEKERFDLQRAANG